jgi:imidazolonepropionase-like amidohydrolase
MHARTLVQARRLLTGAATSPSDADALLVEGDRIVEVGRAEDLGGRATRRVDLGDATLVPGFVDAHTHLTIRPGEGDQHGQLRKPHVWQALRAVRNLQGMVASGVTTARIMGEQAGIDGIVKELVATGELVGPRLFVSGMALSATHGHGAALGVADGVDGVRRAVRENIRNGADHIKIFMTGGVSSTGSSLFAYHYGREEIRAIVDEAHRLGLRVAAHAHGGPGVTMLAEEGVDSVEHGGLLTDENVAAMREHGTWLVLTKTIGHHPDGIERGDAHRPEILAKLQQSRAADAATFGRIRRAGLRFALGTDSMHGLFGHEIAWLVERGVAPDEALRAATLHGAEVIGVEERLGSLEPGKLADVVALGGDYLARPAAAVYDVRFVMKAGDVLVGPSPA